VLAGALKFNAMTDRYRGFLSALGSMRLAGAEPDPEVIELGMRWVHGVIDADDLDTYAKQSAAGLPMTGRATAADPERGYSPRVRCHGQSPPRVPLGPRLDAASGHRAQP